MKLFFKSFLVFSILLTFSCQNQKDFAIAQTYDEPQDPAPSKNEDWSAVPKGLQASITTTDIRFVKSECFDFSLLFLSFWEIDESKFCEAIIV